MREVTVQKRIAVIIAGKTRVRELRCQGMLDEHGAFHPVRCVGTYHTKGAEAAKAVPLPERTAA